MYLNLKLSRLAGRGDINIQMHREFPWEQLWPKERAMWEHAAIQ